MRKKVSDFTKELTRIKLLSLDVDGILTDGGIYYTDKGDSIRKFNAKDGMGITMLINSGIEVAIISSGAPGAIEHRANRLKIKHVFTNVCDKVSILKMLAKELHLKMTEIAHMGDDLNDIEIFENVGLSITVNDAIEPVLMAADIITSKNGGQGAVREICNAMVDKSKPNIPQTK